MPTPILSWQAVDTVVQVPQQGLRGPALLARSLSEASTLEPNAGASGSCRAAAAIDSDTGQQGNTP
jgi:hypothetical protein